MSSVFISDVDDFISPSQACINPLFTATPLPATSSANGTPDPANKGSGVAGTIKTARKIVSRRRRKRTPLSISPHSVADSVATIIDSNKIVPSNATSITTITTNITTAVPPPTTTTAVPRPYQTPPIIHPTVRTASIIRTKRPALSYHAEPSPSLKYDTTFPPPPSSITPDVQPKKKKATISVADCLACSGCVTSSEAVLVTSQHSVERLLRRCGEEKEGKEIVFTISPVAVADILRVLYPHTMAKRDDPDRTNPSPTYVYRKLATFLQRRFHAGRVLDGSVVQRISIVESAREFCRRYRYLHSSPTTMTAPPPHPPSLPQQPPHSPMHIDPHPYPETTLTSTEHHHRQHEDEPWNALRHTERTTLSQHPQITLSTPSIALSATHTRYLLPRPREQREEGPVPVEIHHGAGADPRLPFLHGREGVLEGEVGSERVLPMLASSCPGFVCYVEKTAGGLVPYLSTVKSPMAIAGSLLKHGSFYGQGGVSAPSQGQDQKKNRDRDGFFHVAVMPCHDKKLEAGRRDLAYRRPGTVGDEGGDNGDEPVPDVDLVVTTDELVGVLVDVAQSTGGPFRCDEDGDCVMEEGGDRTDDVTPGGQRLKRGIDAVRGYLDSLPSAPVKILGDDDYNGRATEEPGAVFVATTAENVQKHHGDTNDPSVTASRALGNVTTAVPPPPQQPTGFGIGSGGYAEFIFRYACRELFNVSIAPDEALPWKRVVRAGGGSTTTPNNRAPRAGNNVVRRRRRTRPGGDGTTVPDVAAFDRCEVLLYRLAGCGGYSLTAGRDGGEGGNATVVLRFAIAYGFKNVQLVQQRLLSDDGGYRDDDPERLHYVEMMACPSGCPNGGGRIRDETLAVAVDPAPTGTGEGAAVAEGGTERKRETPAERRARVVRSLDLMSGPWIDGGGGGGENDGVVAVRESLLHTRFHVVPKLELTTGATAGVALDDTKW